MSDSNPTSGDTPGVPPAGGTPPPAPPAPPPPPPGGYGQVPAPGIAPNGKKYAPWIWRVLSYIIDQIPAVVILAVGWVCLFLSFSTSDVTTQSTSPSGTSNSESTSASTGGWGMAVFVLCYVIALVYWFWNKGYREGTTGKSIGKSVTGYTTVNEETGEPLGAGMGIVRVLLLYVDFAICYIGVLWPLWDPKRQALLSDKVTKAVVYKD